MPEATTGDRVYALVSLLVVGSLAFLVVGIVTVALRMTGLSTETSSLQALSAFSGAGFTIRESEEVTAYPVRQRFVKALIRLGSVGLVTTVPHSTGPFVRFPHPGSVRQKRRTTDPNAPGSGAASSGTPASELLRREDGAPADRQRTRDVTARSR